MLRSRTGSACGTTDLATSLLRAWRLSGKERPHTHGLTPTVGWRSGRWPVGSRWASSWSMSTVIVPNSPMISACDEAALASRGRGIAGDEGADPVADGAGAFHLDRQRLGDELAAAQALRLHLRPWLSSGWCQEPERAGLDSAAVCEARPGAMPAGLTGNQSLSGGWTSPARSSASARPAMRRA
jgi:hypothetical protein